MFARAIQIFLILLGALLVLALLVPVPATSGSQAGSGYQVGLFAGRILDITVGFLCFLGAYKIGKRRKKQI